MSKILLYIDSMQRGGAQRVMSVLAENLINEGVEVTLVNDIPPVEGVPEYNLPEKVKRVYLDRTTNMSAIRKNVHRIRALRKIIAADKYTCAMSFLGPPNIRLIVSTLGLPVRTIVSVRNDPRVEYGSGLKGLALKQFFRIADLSIFQTKEASSFFPFMVQKKSRVIPNPIRDDFYNHKWSGNGKDLVAVGRLQPQKNYELMIKSFAKVANSFPDTNLRICGDGPLRDKLIVLADYLGIKNRVVFLGDVTNVKAELEKALFFVLSSDYEGMPNSLMEAMAVGVPIIATDCPCGGPRELTDSGRFGILVPSNDVNALSMAMKKLLSSKAELETMHEKSIERSKEYKTDVVMKKWFDAFGLSALK